MHKRETRVKKHPMWRYCLKGNYTLTKTSSLYQNNVSLMKVKKVIWMILIHSVFKWTDGLSRFLRYCMLLFQGNWMNPITPTKCIHDDITIMVRQCLKLYYYLDSRLKTWEYFLCCPEGDNVTKLCICKFTKTHSFTTNILLSCYSRCIFSIY